MEFVDPKRTIDQGTTCSMYLQHQARSSARLPRLKELPLKRVTLLCPIAHKSVHTERTCPVSLRRRPKFCAVLGGTTEDWQGKDQESIWMDYIRGAHDKGHIGLLAGYTSSQCSDDFAKKPVSFPGCGSRRRSGCERRGPSSKRHREAEVHGGVKGRIQGVGDALSASGKRENFQRREYERHHRS